MVEAMLVSNMIGYNNHMEKCSCIEWDYRIGFLNLIFSVGHAATQKLFHVTTFINSQYVRFKGCGVDHMWKLEVFKIGMGLLTSSLLTLCNTRSY